MKLDNSTSQTQRELGNEHPLSEDMEAPSPKRVRMTLVPKTSSYELRAFSLLQNYDGVDKKIDPHCGVKDTIILAAVPAKFHGPLLRQALKSHMWTNGHLIFSKEAEKTSSQFLANVITRHFDPACVLDWLNYCNEHHKTLCQSATEMANIRLIDCHDRIIVPASCHMTYVALSYVWAKVNPFIENGILPADLPRGIEDAMEVTKNLGFRYIWIDKYCIYQNSDQDKGHQIRQMDMIYQGSVLTIIAAAGDENTGLPGIGSTPRTIQPVLSLENSTIISTMPHPHHVIKRSTWMTRGWTLQESILARRRLVFTEDQVYFECNAMNCFESLAVPLDLVHTKTKDRFYSFMRSGLFNGRDEGLKGHIFGLPFGRFDDRSESWEYNFRKS
jgi:hypothetical protein